MIPTELDISGPQRADDAGTEQANSDPQPLFMAELGVIYRDLDREIVAIGPSCVLSGRCCRFREYGHTLFVSGPEMRFLLDKAPEPVRPLDQGETCPWQDQNGRCQARDARPLGCRIYYCDPSYESRAAALSEAYIARLKSMADRHNLSWDYAPLHRHLDRALQDRLFRDATTNPNDGSSTGHSA
jgi:hypothetical protein